MHYCSGQQVAKTKHLSVDLLVLVENLHPHESVEDKTGQLFELTLTGVTENLWAAEIEDECHNKLVDRLPYDHLPHGQSDQRSRFRLWLSLKQTGSRRIGGQCQRSKRVHDQIHPKQLHSGEDGALIATGYCRHKGQDDCRNIDSDLKLDTLLVSILMAQEKTHLPVRIF